jgi:2,4-dienoyl-CoA reductase-like NADH-dependent reductase (Old Yellow Enzyme family)/thioredoxin reductase
MEADMITELFKPLNIGNVTIKNRLVVSAMVMDICNPDGTLTDRFIRYHEEKAKGGWGLIITEDYGVSADGKGYPLIPGLWCDEQIEKNKELTSLVHSYGSKIFCQLYHAGNQKMAVVPGHAVAPSAIKNNLTMNMPTELTVEEIHEIARQFGENAYRAKLAGFDGVEIHAAHGYLITEFLSYSVNKRTDEYGGCFTNRCRFFDEIYAQIREKVGNDFAVTVKMSVNEYAPGGIKEPEGYTFARHCDDLGVDAILVSNGAYASDPNHSCITNMFADNALNTDASKQIKEMVSCPVITVNKIYDPEMADTMIKMGKADFIAMGRQSLADPYYPAKVQEGRLDEVNPCINCLQGCLQGLLTSRPTCLVSPRTTNEVECEITPAQTKKDVMIIGAGPAGLMAARTAAQRGHKVTVYDQDTHFGGSFRAAAFPVGKGAISGVISSYRRQCETLGVTFCMGTEVTEDLIFAKKPDAVVIATGSTPLMPPIKGIDNPHVVTAEDVLLGVKDIPAGPVVVCGGGEVGGETAEFIALTNPAVTILEMKPEILSDMFLFNKVAVLESLQRKGIRVIAEATVSEIGDDHVSYKDAVGKTITIPAATVVSAFGYRAHNPLETIARKTCEEIYVVGSAVKAGNALTAIKEGYKAGLMM